MGATKAGKIPPRELVPRLYKRFKQNEFTRQNVERYLGKSAAVSITRALHDGWLNTKRKVDLVNVYVLSNKALTLLDVGDAYVCRRTC